MIEFGNPFTRDLKNKSIKRKFPTVTFGEVNEKSGYEVTILLTSFYWTTNSRVWLACPEMTISMKNGDSLTASLYTVKYARSVWTNLQTIDIEAIVVVFDN